MKDKIYRSGTEELAMYKVGPQTIRHNQAEMIPELDYKLFNSTQVDTRFVDVQKPQVVRKKSMNKQ